MPTPLLTRIVTLRFGGFESNRRSISTVVEYNYTSQKFATHTPLPEPRACSVAAAVDEHRLLVVGGFTNTFVGSCCLLYDSRARKWFTDWPDLNIARCYHACVCITTTTTRWYMPLAATTPVLWTALKSWIYLLVSHDGESSLNDSRRNVLDAPSSSIPRTPTALLLLVVRARIRARLYC